MMSDITVNITDVQEIVIRTNEQGPDGIQGPPGEPGAQGEPGEPGVTLVESVNGKQGVVVLSKGDIGLGSVDNTPDLSKPVSTAQAEAIAVVQADVDSHEADMANPHGVTKAQVGLGSVDNTSDIAKPVSTAQAAAISAVQGDIDSHEADLANPHGVTKSQVGLANVTNDAQIPLTQKGAAGGVAELDGTGKVPASQLPSFVDDVVEYANFASLPVTGEAGKIYVTTDDNLTYRWSGSGYVMISSSLALGETASTAYRGDRGKVAYDHSQTTGNPHGTTKGDIGLGNVNNTADIDKPVSTAQSAAIAVVQGSLDTHIADTSNPHGVTKAQVGLGSVENTALSTWAGSGNITTLGTVASGIWNATEIAVTKGGTGLTSIADAGVLVSNAANVLSVLTAGASQSIRRNAGNTAWEAYTPTGFSWGASATPGSGTAITLSTTDLNGANPFMSMSHVASGTLTACTATQFTLSTSRTHTAATSVTDNFIGALFSRTNVLNGAGATLLAQGDVVRIAGVDTLTTGTALTPSYNLLALAPSTRSTGASISLSVPNSVVTAPTNGHIYAVIGGTQTVFQTLMYLDVGGAAVANRAIYLTGGSLTGPNISMREYKGTSRAHGIDVSFASNANGLMFMTKGASFGNGSAYSTYINSSGQGGFVGLLENSQTANRSFGRLLHLAFGDTQSNQDRVAQIDTGTSAQAITGLLVNVANANASARGVDIQLSTTGTGNAINASSGLSTYSGSLILASIGANSSTSGADAIRAGSGNVFASMTYYPAGGTNRKLFYASSDNSTWDQSYYTTAQSGGLSDITKTYNYREILITRNSTSGTNTDTITAGYYKRSTTTTGVGGTTNAVGSVFKAENISVQTNGTLNDSVDIYNATQTNTSGTVTGKIFTGVVGATERFKVHPLVANGASAVAYLFDTATSLATSGAKIASFGNAGTEKAFIDKDGGFRNDGANTWKFQGATAPGSNVMDTTNVLNVTVAGTSYKLALVA